MYKLVWLLAGVLITAIAVLMWVLLVPIPGAASVDAAPSVSSTGRIDDTQTPAAAALPPAIPARAPRAVAEDDQYDFHIMDPGQTAQHTFLIRNDGDSPLTLKIGPTTCKCTVADLPHSVVAPGATGSLGVQWTTLYQPGLYLQSASVMTNDPLNPKIQFSVYGKIRAQVGMAPEALVFPRVSPDRTTVQTALVYSQVWPEFSIRKIDTPIEGLRWETLPAAPESLDPLHARSGFVLRVTLPPGLGAGYFSHWLRLHVDAPSSHETPPVYQVAIHGKVLRRLCVYGSGIDGTGVVNLGRIQTGKGAHVRLLVKVRDPQRELAVDHMELTPEFLQVRITAHKPEQERSRGLYDLEIAVPRDAPRCVYMGAPAGRIRIVLDHPTIPELDLPVTFAVIDTD